MGSEGGFLLCVLFATPQGPLGGGAPTGADWGLKKTPGCLPHIGWPQCFCSLWWLGTLRRHTQIVFFVDPAPMGASPTGASTGVASLEARPPPQPLPPSPAFAPARHLPAPALLPAPHPHSQPSPSPAKTPHPGRARPLWGLASLLLCSLRICLCCDSAQRRHLTSNPSAQKCWGIILVWGGRPKPTSFCPPHPPPLRSPTSSKCCSHQTTKLLLNKQLPSLRVEFWFLME